MRIERVGGELKVQIGGGPAPFLLGLQFTSGDGFIKTLLGAVNSTAQLPERLEWSSLTGLALGGVKGRTFQIPIEKRVLTVDFKTLTIEAQSAPAGLLLSAGLTGDGSLGPLLAQVQNVGLTLSVTPAAGGIDLEVKFKPPTGVGLRLNAGPITGGGFIGIEPGGRYSGTLYFSVAGISVKAIGLLDTNVPDAKFSFLILIFAESLNLQLGFGFTLNGLGGVFGIHRRLAGDALRDVVLQGRLANVLFPTDPVANAPQIISDLRAIFPTHADSYVFGFMLQLAWGTPALIEGTAGVVLSLPDGVFALLGMVTAYLPAREAAVLVLDGQFTGILDPPAKRFQFAAFLKASSFAGYTLSGQMAMVTSWGTPSFILFTAGGFNPRFQAESTGLPPLQRLTLDLGISSPRLVIRAYFAITSNTLQFGAECSLSAEAGPLSIRGGVGLDMLMVRSPLGFRTDFRAFVEVRFDDDLVAGMWLNASLSGPRPWVADGIVCVSLAIFKGCVPFRFRIGSSDPAQLPPGEHPRGPLLAALTEPQNWSAEPPSAYVQIVSLKPQPSKISSVLLDPAGAARVLQHVVPLNTLVQKYAETQVLPPVTFQVSVKIDGVPVSSLEMASDVFAPEQYQNLNDQQKLSLPSFAPRDAGFKVGANAASKGIQKEQPLEYKTEYFDTDTGILQAAVYSLSEFMQAAMVNSGPVVRAQVEGMVAGKPDPKPHLNVAVEPEKFVVVSSEDLKAQIEITPEAAGQYEAHEALERYLLIHPEKRPMLQIVPLADAA